MKIMTVNNLSIISEQTKKAKYCTFEKGINVVTSDSVKSEGNFVGKSSLLRSIFHTLGADARFSDMWEKEGKYIYILEFCVDDVHYTILRFDSLFKLFDKNNELLFMVSNRDQLALQFKEIFGFNIYLMNHAKKYVLAAPAISYLLNFIDQTEIKCCSFSSFKNLNEYSDWYSDAINALVGVKNDSYNRLKTELNEKQTELKLKNERNIFYDNMLNELDDKNELPIVNMDAILAEMKKYENEFGKTSKVLYEIKDKIFKTISAKKEVEILIAELQTLLKKQNKEIKSILKHNCPVCHKELEDNSLIYFSKTIDNENYESSILLLEKELCELERTLNLEKDKYVIESAKLKEIEKQISKVDNEADVSIKQLGIRNIKEKVLIDFGKNSQEIASLELRISEIRKQQAQIEKIKKQINQEYKELMLRAIQKYNLASIDTNKFEKIELKFNPNGTETNIALVIWLTTLLSLKYEYNKESMIFPLVYDTPNNANITDENEKRIFEVIFDSLPKDGQIITSTIGFNESLYPNHQITKTIELTEQYALLNSNDYVKCNEVLKKYIQ